jgi:NADH-quinone oxidoreductase subunit J
MQLHGWEAALFYVLAIMTLFMAVFVVTARVAVHSALFLISTLVNVALLFILLHAEFVAGVQILVYVGGVMVLFLFVIMLVQTRAEEESRVRLYTRQTWPAVIIALLLAVSFYFAMNPAQGVFRPSDSTASAPVVAEGTERTTAVPG